MFAQKQEARKNVTYGVTGISTLETRTQGGAN